MWVWWFPKNMACMYDLIWKLKPMLAYTLRLGLDPAFAFAFTFLHFFFFFFFPAAAHSIRGQRLLFIWTVAGNCWLFNFFYQFCDPWTVHGTHKSHFWVTFSLKLGPTLLFTYLKIILLQCFQFSVFSFSKISSIQTNL